MCRNIVFVCLIYVRRTLRRTLFGPVLCGVAVFHIRRLLSEYGLLVYSLSSRLKNLRTMFSFLVGLGALLVVAFWGSTATLGFALRFL